MRAYDTSFRGFDEGNIFVNHRLSCARPQNFQSILWQHSTSAKRGVSPSSCIDRSGWDSRSTHANNVQAARIICVGHQEEWADVITCSSKSADETTAAESHKLMHSSRTAGDDSICNIDMACKQSSIGKYAVVSHCAVVAGVGIRHPIITVADATRKFHLWSRNCHPFTKDIVRSDDDSLAREIGRRSKILRRAADASIRIELVVLTDGQRAFQLHPRSENRSRTDCDWPECSHQVAPRADHDIVGERDISFNDRSGVNRWHDERIAPHPTIVDDGFLPQDSQ